MTIHAIDRALRRYLRFADYAALDAPNGIQVDHEPRDVRRVAVAVDASEPVLAAAAAQRADAIFVHHGLFWKTTEPLAGALYRKARILITNGIALYAAHLPLDAHLRIGNNAQIASRIGLGSIKPFGFYKGAAVGVRGLLKNPRSADEIITALFAASEKNSRATDSSCAAYAAQYGLAAVPAENASTKAPRVLAAALHGPKRVKSVAVVSGSGAFALEEAAAAGVHALITGDASHTAALRARELGLHLISAGHYFTEIWGPLALGRHVLQLLTKAATKAYTTAAENTSKKNSRASGADVFFIDDCTHQ